MNFRQLITLYYKTKGETLGRIITNNILEEIELKGQVLEMGPGVIRKNFVYKDNGYNLTTIGLKDNNPDVIADLEYRLPIEDESYDKILVICVLEHIYNYQDLVNEIYRILKKGGVVYCLVPFIEGIHNAPKDYFRYTSNALERIFEEYDNEIIPIGNSFDICMGTLTDFKTNKIFGLLVIAFFDFMKTFFKEIQKKDYPIGYFVKARK